MRPVSPSANRSSRSARTSCTPPSGRTAVNPPARSSTSRVPSPDWTTSHGWSSPSATTETSRTGTPSAGGGTDDEADGGSPGGAGASLTAASVQPATSSRAAAMQGPAASARVLGGMGVPLQAGQGPHGPSMPSAGAGHHVVAEGREGVPDVAGGNGGQTRAAAVGVLRQDLVRSLQRGGGAQQGQRLG